MSTAVVSTSAALGRLFVFDDEPDAAKPCHPERSEKCVLDRILQSTLKNQQSTIAVPASRLSIRSTPEMASSGIAALDSLTGGLPRGCLTEIFGPASSGRTTVLLAALAAATRRGEFCALLDAGDSFDPGSAAAAGVDLDRLLWVRCSEEQSQKNHSPQRHRVSEKQTNKKTSRASEHRLEQLLRATDLLLESGGFSLIVLDLADLPPQAAHRIPLTTWFRFRRAVEHKPTILLAIEEQPIAGSCSTLLLQLGSSAINAVPAGLNSFSASLSRHSRGGLTDSVATRLENLSHTHLLTELNINVELAQSRIERKPAQSIKFAVKTAWTG
ncbi:MAG TPA: hypothetical protein VMH04_11230 [Candidatus Solibacter sp.]|nr:hypothetical protein [Candidatus Solibacter sp.]